MTLDLDNYEDEMEWNSCYLGVEYMNIFFPAFNSANANKHSYLLLKRLEFLVYSL